MHGRITQASGTWWVRVSTNHGRDYGDCTEGVDEMKLVGLAMAAGAWIGGGWYFAVVGWIIFEYGSLNGGVVSGRKDGKIQTVRKQDDVASKGR